MIVSIRLWGKKQVKFSKFKIFELMKEKTTRVSLSNFLFTVYAIPKFLKRILRLGMEKFSKQTFHF